MKNPCRRGRHLLGAITTISMLVFSGTAAGLLGWLFYSLDTPIGVTVVKDFLLQVNGQHHLIILSPSNGLPVLRGALGTALPSSPSFKLRSNNDVSAHATIADTDLRISVEIEENLKVYTIQWHYSGIKHTIQDCFSLQNAIWFAAPSEFKEPWPLKDTHLSDTPLLPSIGIYERFWLSSNGVAIALPSDLPVFLSFNATVPENVCFKGFKYQKNANSLRLKYRIIAGPDIKHVHAYMLSLSPKPLDTPSKLLFEKPSWSVYPSYWKPFQLETYTKHILFHGFNGSLLLFDTDYLERELSQTRNTKYQRSKQNNGMTINKGLIALKRELGYITRREMCPAMFLSLKVTSRGLDMKPNFGLDNEQRTNIRHSDKKRFYSLISAVHEMDICSVVLAITVNTEISDYVPSQTPLSRNLHFIRSVVNHTSNEFTNTLLTRPIASPWMHQFILMDDRTLSWDALGSILPEAFSCGIAGYPFLMAPGLALQNTSQSPPGQLDAELYMRWIQLVALFPAVRISLPPWSYPKQVIGHVAEMFGVRRTYLSRILKSAQSAIHSGFPIIRPMWMLHPTMDPAVISINDQFSIAQDVVVAPVLKKGIRSRGIYLPPGDWWDTLHLKRLKGDTFIHNYQVQLEQLPVFTRIKIEKEET